MNLNDLRSLDPKRIGSWPLPLRMLVWLLLMAAVAGAGYWFITKPQMEDLAKAEKKEVELKTSFEIKQRKAANLEPLKLQLQEMNQSFGAMLKLLPNRTELEGLLVDISQSGLASGLEFELFKPEKEKKAEFYAIQPINIRVTGNYEEFGAFIEAVAALPRIVTQHNIKMKPKGETLSMDMEARTYRYLDEDELAALEASKKPKKKRRGRK